MFINDLEVHIAIATDQIRWRSKISRWVNNEENEAVLQNNADHLGSSTHENNMQFKISKLQLRAEEQGIRVRATDRGTACWKAVTRKGT